MQTNVLLLYGGFILSAWQLAHLISFSIVHRPSRWKLMFHYAFFLSIIRNKHKMESSIGPICELLLNGYVD